MPEQNSVASFFRSKYVRVLSLVLVGQAALFYSASRGEVVPNSAPLLAFPATLGAWHLAKEETIDQETLDVLKADDTLSRWYLGPNGPVEMFIAFFKTQRTGQAPHSPKNCLPGSGWQPVRSGTGKIDVDTAAGAIQINHFLVTKGDATSLVLYWYQSQGRVIADEFAAKFYLVADSIRKHRSDTALVRVVVPVLNGEEEKAEAMAREFVKDAYPVVSGYLPK